ncbi:3,4-dihydroxy-2-butanone 4-phosphate synthase / GTP cyclohydrolase II [Roseibacterium elongatum DSM 19469]|uniref:GTP cyclohydrolase-2 n=1 Tax=Roseicyclus elongatus DSM 19469 TaxID=1294273 RepID=W8RZF2_9RHOB|nr:GTP cyclohydrolase II [Roseibacterium elongatum]AHM03257.1 3,4-dihydroxy-2-butanone 4-phosphate synthase / GTP cyclohydrolase II [Roseibacterium elongatum DSM 19469]
MILLPTPAELMARARSDLRVGLPVVLGDGAEGVLVLAAETARADRLAALRALPGPVTVAITERRAETLKARAYDGDLARVVMPPDADAGWLRDLADPARDLIAPMKGPLLTARDGSAGLHRLALLLAKSAHLLPAMVCTPLPDPAQFASDHLLTLLRPETAAEDLAQHHPLLPVAAARLPIEASEAGRLHIFRPDNGGIEHYAIEIGQPDRDAPVLARLHSACFTGDVLGSLKCDCGPQLRTALADMGRAGAGVLLYLNQEGRGIGLTNKMRAYSLQDQGFDTVEANHRLGFEDDERDFRIGADILRRMGFGAVRLMTNNPRKVTMMEGEGITVTERVPLVTGTNRHNAHYLETKARKSGHLL